MQLTQTRPVPGSVAKITYVKTADTLTISAKGQVIFLKDPDGKIFNSIKDGQVDRAGEFLVMDNIGMSQLSLALKMSEHRDFVTHNGKLFFASSDGLTEIDPQLAHRLIQLKEASLPHYPLLKFWAKFVQSSGYLESSVAERELLFAQVGTATFPLTWDGQMLAYFRAHTDSMPPSSGKSSTSDGLFFRTFNRTTMFDPDSEVEVAGRLFNCHDKPLFSLASVTSVCMDQGSIYEVEVNPANLIQLRLGRSHEPVVYASSAIGIRSLGLLSNERNEGIIEVPVTHCTGGLSLRDPSSGDATAAYLTELAGSDDQGLARLADRQSSLPAIRTSGC
jgi:hypothetical protein